MTIRIIFGTESGNAELIASDIEDQLSADHEVEVEDLAEIDVNDFSADDVHLVICSTHGEGDLPYSAQPFVAALNEATPDLTGIHYAMFGLGDSTYKNYSRGSERVDEALTDCGAKRVGDYGRHDAASSQDPSELGIAWAEQTLAAWPVASAV
ncbi:flavodoxin domain-containing protein [Gulosibacter bifidus]|uniref:Flavodoxin domain-containing protein n=1 Tax=Gulosibacter bifidus TaxID=272239 RepID=A0ABW5RHD8_9MICO|nr:flavodoxin domain-containing protein [Gulosibacter bifidus]